jgi:hypothetical protein
MVIHRCDRRSAAMPTTTTTGSGLGLLAAVLAALSLLSAPAQTQDGAGAEKKPATQTTPPAPAAKKPVAGPFHGKLAAVDRAARTIKVGKRTFHITPETRLRKADKPATLEDAVVGEPCSGYVKPAGDGRWIASSVNLGAKPPAAGSTSKQSAPATSKTGH